MRERDGVIRSQDCRRGGMADASDSKSDAGNSVWVQVPSPALVHLLGSLEISGLKASFMFELMLFWVRPR